MRTVKLLVCLCAMIALLLECSKNDPPTKVQPDIRSSYWILHNDQNSLDTMVDNASQALEFTGDSLITWYNGTFIDNSPWTYKCAVPCTVEEDVILVPGDSLSYAFKNGGLVLTSHFSGFAQTFSRYDGTFPPSCWAPILSGDAYEPDNSKGAAGAITPNSPAQQRTLTLGDTDFVKFAATAGTKYRIFDSSENVYSYLYLYRGDSLLSPYRSGLTANLSWTCQVTDTYYVKVFTTGNQGTYTLGMTADPGDSYEPDGTPATASTITANGTVQSHTLRDGDCDWIAFSATAGATYRIGDSSATLNTYLRLYGSDSTTSITYSSGRAPYLVWACPASGTYFIKVYSQNSYDSGAYTLAVTADRGDSFEPDGTPSTASTITVNGAAQSHTIKNGDCDWIAFSATAGTTYRIVDSSATLNSYLYLYGTDGTSPINYNSGRASSLVWVCPTSGTYFLNVYSQSPYDSGAYTLRVNSIAPDSYEPDNTPATASSITVNGSAQEHTITANDNDFIRFDAAAGTIYTISDSGNGTFYNDLILVGADGATSVATTSGYSPRLTWTCTTSGTYYIRVNASSSYYSTSSYIGTYFLSVTGVTLQQPGATAATATIVTSSDTCCYYYHVGGASDYFKFAATAGVTYIIVDSTGFYSSMYLYGTDGTTQINSYSGYASSCTFTCSATGTYYVKVVGSGSSYSGTYTLQVKAIVPDAFEPDSTLSKASTITVNGTGQQHTLIANDVDYVKFTATAGTTYSVTGSSTTISSYMYLLGTDGVTTLKYASGNNPSLSWTCTEPGTYYLQISGSNLTAKGFYTLKVSS